MGVNFIKISKFGYFKKFEKVFTKLSNQQSKILNICAVKLEVEISSNCAQIRGLIKNETGLHLSCNLHKMGANTYSKIAVAHFCAKKVWFWMDGWMDGWQSWIKDCLQQSEIKLQKGMKMLSSKKWALGRWVDGWAGAWKLDLGF